MDGTERCRVVVCGSGNGAQTAAGMLGHQGHHVSLYFSPRYQQRADMLRANLASNGGCITLTTHTAPTAAAPEGATTVQGAVEHVSTCAAEVVPSANIVIVSTTGDAMEPLIRELAPYLHQQQLLLLLQGMGPVNYMQLKAAMQEAGRARRTPLFAAAKVLPWACRLQAPGRIDVCGTKAHVELALGPNTSPLLRVALPQLLGSLFPGTRFLLHPNALEATFFPYDVLGNDVLHPGIMYATWHDWDGTPLPQRPLFYHSVSSAAADLVEELTSETQAVMAAMCRQMGLSEPVYVPDVRTDLASLYADRVVDASTLHSVLTTNAAYAGIYHPMRPAPGGAAGFVPDFSTRLLSEDVPCGLVAVRGIAEVLGVATPRIDAVIIWAQEKLGKEYLLGGRLAGRHVCESGAPQRFGASRPEELVITAAVPEEDGQAYVAAAAAAQALSPSVARSAAVSSPCSTAMSRSVSCPVHVHCC